MPIRRYVEKGVVFTPQALSAMSKALEATQTEILGIIRGLAKPRRWPDQVAPLASPKEDRCQRSGSGCAMRARLFG